MERIKHMDIGYKNPDGFFSMRSAALIIRNNKLLTAKSDNFDCFYTVGGGILQNETSENAAVRETYEETGCRFEIDRLVFIQERFYKLRNISHHEVVFFYLMKNAGFDIRNGANTDRQNEHLYWLPLDKLEKIDLVPLFLKTALKNIPSEITHIVSYE